MFIAGPDPVCGRVHYLLSVRSSDGGRQPIATIGGEATEAAGQIRAFPPWKYSRKAFERRTGFNKNDLCGFLPQYEVEAERERRALLVKASTSANRHTKVIDA